MAAAREHWSLNALSGIGGVQTYDVVPQITAVLWPLSLNALSGIGGVQTRCHSARLRRTQQVLMPCRALEAFRLRSLVR